LERFYPPYFRPFSNVISIKYLKHGGDRRWRYGWLHVQVLYRSNWLVLLKSKIFDCTNEYHGFSVYLAIDLGLTLWCNWREVIYCMFWLYVYWCH
jgi:hypothetical protein